MGVPVVTASKRYQAAAGRTCVLAVVLIVGAIVAETVACDDFVELTKHPAVPADGCGYLDVACKAQKAGQHSDEAPLQGRVAAVFGATFGVGQAMAVRLAKAGCTVVIFGRNLEAGQATLDELIRVTPALPSPPPHRFVPADLSNLAQTRATLDAQLLAAVDRLDYIVFCQTKSTMQGRTLTPEGIDEKLVLNYYSRVFIVNHLLPVLKRTAAAGADVRVMSILSAGVHSPYDLYRTDPELAEHYSLGNAANLAGFYTDLWLDKMSRTTPEITFLHAAPGFVATNWGVDLPTVVRWLVRAFQATPFAKSADTCAELLAQGLLLPSHRGGLQLIDQYAKPAAKTAAHDDCAVDFVWDHTLALLRRAGV